MTDWESGGNLCDVNEEREVKHSLRPVKRAASTGSTDVAEIIGLIRKIINKLVQY